MKCLLNRKGMTMVSVIIGFAILMTGSVLFYKAIDLSIKLTDRADKERTLVENSIENYYLNRDTNVDENKTAELDFGDFKIKSKVYSFKDSKYQFNYFSGN